MTSSRYGFPVPKGRKFQGVVDVEKIDHLEDHYIANRKYQFSKKLRPYRKEEGFELPHAAIYTGKEVATGDDVVIKVIKREYRGKKDHEELTKSFYNEVQVMCELNGHPGIITFLDAYVTDTMYILVMEMGKSVFENELNDIRSAVKDPKEFEAIVRKLFHQIVDALDFMHAKHIYHRDIKLTNILVCNKGDDFRAIKLKLIDFGIAMKCKDRRCLEKGGTLDYQAPETLYCDEYYDPAPADVWSLGVMLFQMLTGWLPFLKEHYTTNLEAARKILKSHINWASEEFTAPPLARDLLQRMLRPDPNSRYSLEQIKRHRWFKVDYEPTVYTAPPQGKYKIMIIPDPKDPKDTSSDGPEQRNDREWNPVEVGAHIEAAVLPKP